MKLLSQNITVPKGAKNQLHKAEEARRLRINMLGWKNSWLMNSLNWRIFFQDGFGSTIGVGWLIFFFKWSHPLLRWLIYLAHDLFLSTFCSAFWLNSFNVGSWLRAQRILPHIMSSWACGWDLHSMEPLYNFPNFSDYYWE